MRTLFISILAVALSVSTVYAETTVINSINVSARSGGSVVKNGEVRQGTSVSSVDITTTVNSETVEDIHERTTDGTPIRIERTTYATSSDASVRTNIESTTRTTTAVESEGAAERTTEVTSIRAPNAARDNASTSTTIISVSTTSEEDMTSEQGSRPESASLFTRIIDSVARAIVYVLSSIFS
jgi:hypothetical protein